MQAVSGIYALLHLLDTKHVKSKGQRTCGLLIASVPSASDYSNTDR